MNDNAHFETRVRPGLELRVGGNARPRLVGWAAKFNTDSLDLGGFVEVIRPGAFTRTLATGTDVRAFVEHNAAMIIGRRANGSLLIHEDADGLHVEIMPADTQPGRDVIENVRVGNLDGMSFMFRVAPDGATWDLKASPPLRELRDVDLLEVSIVSLPAYPATEVAVRDLTAARADQTARYPQGRTVTERLAWSHAHQR